METTGGGAEGGARTVSAAEGWGYGRAWLETD